MDNAKGHTSVCRQLSVSGMLDLYTRKLVTKIVRDDSIITAV